ncbi:type VI secretion system baseplate subunit TssE [Sphingomonas morindae]|uniref:Type VI secretion system baseplate subunit TssE n=1 Tax=Sphingomonas morindae TaxID=1541170 RepID=A0ABY4XDA5_9SPHN|nr:type VI secretion system baseplate subunit TssE [Sphingomonas morindae]USI74903.1 type VI secretion system baseplate subunit TssE [Sphingomonas morindae]
MSRINPSLFDKLVADLELDGLRDDDAEITGLDRAPRFYTVPRLERFSEAALRATVLRELNWLFNTTSLASAQDLDQAPEVARSVLNYGLADLTGKLLTRQSVQARARDMREAILRFEPRVERRSLDVDVDGGHARANSIAFTIRGDLTTAVRALPVEFRTDVEIDTGAATIWGA